MKNANHPRKQRQGKQLQSTSTVNTETTTGNTAAPPDAVQPGQVIFALPPSQIFCFICNDSYWTTVNQTEVSQSSTTRLLTFCDLFAIKDEERQNMLRLACLTDPFCIPCSQKMNQLQDWIAELELLQKGIESLKTDVSVLMVNSLPNSPNIEGTHSIKSRLVQAYKSSMPSLTKTKTSDAFQSLVLAGETFLEVNEATKPHPNFETHVEEEVIFSQPDIPEEPESNDDDEFETALRSMEVECTELTPNRTHVKTEKEKRQREPAIRLPRSETIPAHPDGRCRLCPSTFKSQVQLSKHIRRKHSGIMHPCRYCDRKFHDTSNRKRHEVSVHINTTRDYFCDRCGKSYKTTWMLKAHIRDTHEGVILKNRMRMDCQCDLCGKVCTSLRNLATHIRHNHKDRGITCSICGKPFKDFHRKRVHERTHLSELELKELYGKTFYYKCSLCPQEDQIGFKTMLKLRQHYAEQHPDEKKLPKVEKKPPVRKRKYFCDQCPAIQGFTRKQGLEVHIQNGHGQQARGIYNKFGKACLICQKPCRDSTRAILHQSTHFPRDYVCELCIFTSRKMKEMVSHYQLVHPEATIPKYRSFRELGVQRYFCPQCPDRAGFSRKFKMRMHMQARHTERYKDKFKDYVSPVEDEEDEDDEEVIKQEDAEDSDQDFREFFEHAEYFEEVKLPRFSRSGRSLKPTKRFLTSKRRRKSASIENEKRLELRLERVDSQWPKGSIKSVRAFKVLNHPDADEVELEEIIKAEFSDEDEEVAEETLEDPLLEPTFHYIDTSQLTSQSESIEVANDDEPVTRQVESANPEFDPTEAELLN